MIYTVTLNPAIDRTVIVNQINTVDVTRVSKTIRQAAGKGINVSSVIQILGGKSVSVYFEAGENGKYITNNLLSRSIDTLSVVVSGDTRENIKVVELNKNNVIELNEKGPTCTLEDIKNLQEKVTSVIKKDDIVVFAGSVPKGLSSNTYELLISYFNNLGVCTVLDASGELFVNGIKGKPHSIKPNLYELSMYAGKKIASIEDALPVIDEILNLGVQEVLLTLGKNGSLYVSKNKKYQVLPLTVTSKNTVGAGDSFLAGYVYALEQKKDVVERMKLASAVATSSVLSETTGPNNISQIDEFISQIEIIEI